MKQFVEVALYSLEICQDALYNMSKELQLPVIIDERT
jgi:hypothetical protein